MDDSVLTIKGVKNIIYKGKRKELLCCCSSFAITLRFNS